MDFNFSAEQLAFKSRFESFCRDHIAPRAREADQAGRIPQANWRALAGAGYFKLFHPPGVGGTNADGPTLGIAMETLGRACAGTMWAATISTALCGKLLWNLGRPHHREEWLAPIVSGEKIGCVAGTERGSGCDQRAYKTVLRRAGSGYRLSGEKLRCSNAPAADLALVLAQLDSGISEETRLAYAVVDLRLPGISRTSLDLVGLRAMPWGNLVFDDVQLAEENVIQNAGLDQVLQSIEWGQLFQSFCSIGIAEAAFDACLTYVMERHAFDRPIAHLQTVHSRLADMRLEIDAARLIALHAACVMAGNRRAGELVVMSKIHATEMAVRAADAAMRTFAGWGLSPQFPIERFYRDSLANVPAGLTTDRLRELLICGDLEVDPWQYEQFNWLSPAGLSLP